MPLGFKHNKVTYLMTGRCYAVPEGGGEAPPPDPPEQPTPDSNPTVTLVAPTHGATVDDGGTPFLATATDDVGVAYVRFYVDGVLVGQESTAPYGWGGEDGVPEYDTSAMSDGPHTFSVVAYDTAGNVSATASATVTIDNTADPPPPSEDDPTAYGYRPPVPAGWTVIENGSTGGITQGVSNKRYYRNCTGGFWGSNINTQDIIFVDCDFYGGTIGGRGHNIQFYGCRMGGVASTGSNGLDGVQVSPSTNGATRPSGWVFQGCTIVDVTRTGSGHTDGIQMGGVLNFTIRYCYFNNVAVEHILTNGWNGTPENVLVDQCYFGTRPTPGGRPVHFSNASGYVSTNCDATNCYTDGGTVTQIESGAVGCSETGTQPLANWPHGVPWSTY